MRSTDDVLHKLLEYMVAEDRLTSVSVKTWFEDASAVALYPDCLIVRTTSAFKKEVLRDTYGDRVRESLGEMFSTPVDFVVLDANEPVPARYHGDTSGLPAPARFTFDDFIVGASNRFAHAAAKAVAEKPARQYNPLFIYGASGLGKTHLIRAIANTIQLNYPHFRVVYIRTDDLVNEVISAIQSNRAEEVRNKYNACDALLIDDVQFIIGKAQTQVEFFNLFNSLYDAHKQIVLTADRAPHEMHTLEQRMRSRFEMGLLADVQPPDYETRIAILQNKCNRIGLDIPEALIDFIADKTTANIRQLEGILNHLKADQELDNTAITMDTVRRAIKDIQIGGGSRPKPALIVSEVGKYFNIDPARLLSKGQSKEIVVPRQVASYLIKQLTDLSLNQIGAELGGQHHTTVMNSIDKVRESMQDDPKIANIVKDLMGNLSSPSSAL